MPTLPANRCSYQFSTGSQCPWKAFFNGRCKEHGGQVAYDKHQNRLYDLASAEADNLTTHDLNDEIGLTRKLLLHLHESWDKSSEDLKLKLPQYNTLLETLRKLTETCQKLNKDTKSLIPKDLFLSRVKDIDSLVKDVIISDEWTSKDELIELISLRTIEYLEQLETQDRDDV